MQESSTIQYFTEKGFEQGIAQGREEGIAQGREEGIAQGREEGVQLGIQQGIQQAEKTSIRKVVLATLAAKFEPDVADTLKPHLEVIDDIDRLNAPHRCRRTSNQP